MPARQHSRYAKWYPVTRYELLKLFAVIIAMWKDRRPNLYDYWSMETYNYTPSFIMKYSQGIDELLYSTMVTHQLPRR